MAFLCASLLPYAVNDNGAGLAELERVFRVQVCGCSSLQRPWGPAAIISHSFCPLPLSPAPALYTDDGLSKHSQKDTTKDCFVRPCSPWTFSTHTNAHSRRIRTQFYFVFYVAISIFSSLFSGLFWSCLWVRGSVGEMVGCPLWGRLKWCPKEIGLTHCRLRTSETRAESVFIRDFIWGAHHGEQIKLGPNLFLIHFSEKLYRVWVLLQMFWCLSQWQGICQKNLCLKAPWEHLHCLWRVFCFIYKPVSALAWLAAVLSGLVWNRMCICMIFLSKTHCSNYILNPQ